MQKITIVVPVYSDWISLEPCLESLASYAPRSFCRVLLINDSGPEADHLEELILEKILDDNLFSYFRNEDNLGFVGTCNRAVFELDETRNDILLLNSDTVISPGSIEEMRDVLYLHERHGAVCPRSNEASISSVPFFRLDNEPNNVEYSIQIHHQILEDLPRYYVSPVAVGFCMLIRRDLIRNYGLFDTVYGKGYNEENDFCLRINQYGFSSVIANRAFVAHVGGASFGESKSELEKKNSQILLSRYPYYHNAVAQFIQFGYSILDRFSPILDPSRTAPQKILVDLHHLSLTMNGSTRNALSFLEFLSTQSNLTKESITIAAQTEAIDFFDLAKWGMKVLPYGEVSDLYDVGISISPVTSVGQLELLHRLCARWVISYLDIIALRTMYLSLPVRQQREVVKASMLNADHIVAISQSSVDDLTTFFPDLHLPSEKISIVYQGVDENWLINDNTSDRLLQQNKRPVVLVLGNKFRHKQTSETLDALLGLTNEIDVKCLSHVSEADHFPAINFLSPGQLSDSEMIELFDGVDVIIFPSTYEGFGLPLAESASQGKPIIVFENETTKEVSSALGLENVHFIQSFDQLEETLNVAFVQKTSSQKEIRKLSEYNADIWKVVQTTLNAPLSQQWLTQRDLNLSSFLSATVMLQSDLDYSRTQQSQLLSLRSVKLAMFISKILLPIRLLSRKIKRRF